MRTIKKKLWDYLHYILLPLRYRIKVIGLDRLKEVRDQSKGILFLSNHVSNTDAAIISTSLSKLGFNIDIWAYDIVFNIPYSTLLTRHMHHIRLKKIPTITDKRYPKLEKRINKIITRTIDGLKQGRNILIFPSGHLKYHASEVIEGKSSVHSILNRYPEAQIVLIRIQGLWGSRFSWSSKSYEHWMSDKKLQADLFWSMVKMFFLNAIFFIPKRKITLEFIPAPSDFPFQGTKIEINQYLTHFYNATWDEKGEPLNRVPDYFWSKQTIEHGQTLHAYHFDLSQVPSEVQEQVLDIIRIFTKKEKIELTDLLDLDLSLVSLDITAILTELQSKFDVPSLVPAHVTTVGHLIALAAHIPIQEVVTEVNLAKEPLTPIQNKTTQIFKMTI